MRIGLRWSKGCRKWPIGYSCTMRICGRDTTRLLGLVPRGVSDPVYNYDAAAASAEPVSISWVIPGGPAARSGLQEGDRIVEINGESLSLGPEAWYLLNDLVRGHADDVVNLAIERAGSRSQVAVNPVPACDYEVELSESQDVNALAQQRHVLVTAGMIILLPRDEHLAVVIGHELGHIAAGHTQGGFDPNMREDAEAEADYLGVYLAARAGYDVSEAGDVLLRIATVRHSGLVDAEYGASVAQRLRAIKTATDEVETKRTLGEDLYPSSERLLHHAWN